MKKENIYMLKKLKMKIKCLYQEIRDKYKDFVYKRKCKKQRMKWGFSIEDTIDMNTSLAKLISNWLIYFTDKNLIVHIKKIEGDKIILYECDKNTNEFKDILLNLARTFEDYANLDKIYKAKMDVKLKKYGLPEYDTDAFYTVCAYDEKKLDYNGTKKNVFDIVVDLELETQKEVEEIEKKLLKKMKNLFEYNIYHNLYT